MNRLLRVERWCLWGHVVSMAFGLAGLLWVMPHPGVLEYLPAGSKLFSWSMAGGGVVYILLGFVAVCLYGIRTLGWKALMGFLVPSIFISLASELSGTSMGFPFGDYSYLNGLGYKVAGLVPFTIPLSWFYLGLSAYLLARGGLLAGRAAWWKHGLALAAGALLLMSWDFVLDPAMSQTAMPFWYWHTPGAFFGMPYENFAGWFFTGLVFMGVAAAFWRGNDRVVGLSRAELRLPLAIYLANFAFAMVMSLVSGIVTPVLLGILVGALPAVACWLAAPSSGGADSSLPVMNIATAAAVSE